MRKAPTPTNETMRLAALRELNILDTAPEERFDRLTRMARRLFDVPIALVSLVDESRQWFKSCFGLSATETPRDISFCGHAILEDHLFLISDTRDDERFADNPLVTGEPKIRFYAGCPLTLRGGMKIGTLCIIDRKPRDFSEKDLEALVDLAAMVVRELEAVQLATLDELTGITNRRGFMMLAEKSLNICRRTGITASLAFIDLDEFKAINDKQGHLEGDAALQRFADTMRRTLRDSDVFARIGGDEFVVLLTNTSPDNAEKVVEKIAAAIRLRQQQDQEGFDLTFSYGIVAFDPARHADIAGLLSEGDQVMYEMKRAKKGEEPHEMDADETGD